jgi:hypothetical protein
MRGRRPETGFQHAIDDRRVDRLIAETPDRPPPAQQTLERRQCRPVERLALLRSRSDDHKW